MLFALVYSWLRLLLDLADVRLRVHDPEAELLLSATSFEWCAARSRGRN
jgi:hypothetical protein